MSTAEFGDPNNGHAPAPVPAPDGLLSPLSVSPEAPVEQLVQPAPLAPPQPVAPVETVDAPTVPVQDMRDVPLGTLIFRAGLLTEEQLEEALQDGMRRGKRLGEVLLERGLVSEGDLGRLLAGQKGLRFVELDAASVDPAAVRLLPVEKARLHSMLPIGFHDGLPVVAVADPSNDLVIENVRRAMNCEPHLVVAGREALHRQIELAYGGASEEVATVAATPEPVAEPVAPVVPDPQPVVAAAPTTPLVVQPQAPPGEGIWLGAPQPGVQGEPVLQTPEPQFQTPEPQFQAPEPQPQTPEPQFQTPEPQPVVTPEPIQPVVAPEPVQPLSVEQPVAEPLAITFTPVEPALTPEPLATPEPFASSEPVFAPQPAVETPASTLDEQTTEPGEEATATWSVLLRLVGGEQLDVGSFKSSDEAKEHAQGVVRQISSDFGWPFFEGRFIRPDVIVSVDLVAPEGDRWLGSSARRQWAQSS